MGKKINRKQKDRLFCFIFVLKKCKPLSEYSWFVEQFRKNQETMDIEAAVDQAIREMPENFVIKSFLMEHQSEVENMLLTEYNEAETMELFREEGREEERANTEKERKRADKEAERADEATKRAALAERRVAELEAMLAAKAD